MTPFLLSTFLGEPPLVCDWIWNLPPNIRVDASILSQSSRTHTHSMSSVLLHFNLATTLHVTAPLQSAAREPVIKSFSLGATRICKVRVGTTPCWQNLISLTTQHATATCVRSTKCYHWKKKKRTWNCTINMFCLIIFFPCADVVYISMISRKLWCYKMQTGLTWSSYYPPSVFMLWRRNLNFLFHAFFPSVANS